jgi:hypothetical protein
MTDLTGEANGGTAEARIRTPIEAPIPRCGDHLGRRTLAYRELDHAVDFKTLLLSRICTVSASTPCAAGARRRSSCWTWIRSESPTYSEQEGSVLQWSAAPTITRCSYSTSLALERYALRPGNVHSADGWRGVLEPVVSRYRGKVKRRYSAATRPSPTRRSTQQQTIALAGAGIVECRLNPRSPTLLIRGCTYCHTAPIGSSSGKCPLNGEAAVSVLKTQCVFYSLDYGLGAYVGSEYGQSNKRPPPG